MLTPKQARFSAALLVMLAAAVVANVAFLQHGPRKERSRLASIPVGTPPSPDEPPKRVGAIAPPPIRLELAHAIGTIAAPAARAQSDHDLSRVASISRMAGFAAVGRQLVEKRSAAEVELRRLALVRDIQRGLAARGYAPGPVNGQLGLVTRAAILAFEHDQGLPLSAEPSEALRTWLQPIRSAVPLPQPRPSRSGAEQAAKVIKNIQQLLIARGHLTGIADGRLDERTMAAIRSFEMANNLVPTGRISGPLAAALVGRQGAARLAQGG